MLLVTENIVDGVVETVATKVESLIDCWFELVDVLLRDGFILCQTGIDCLSDIVGLFRESIIVNRLVS